MFVNSHKAQQWILKSLPEKLMENKALTMCDNTSLELDNYKLYGNTTKEKSGGFLSGKYASNIKICEQLVLDTSYIMRGRAVISKSCVFNVYRVINYLVLT